MMSIQTQTEPKPFFATDGSFEVVHFINNILYILTPTPKWQS